MENKFSFHKLAKANIQHKPLRSFFLLLIVFLFSLAVFSGSLFINALSGGVLQVSARMGADIMIVPSGYKTNVEAVLLKGEPSTFYLPKDTLEVLKQQPGVLKTTPQLYIATLSASCCSYPLQIIGIDTASDFLVQPWLRQTLPRTLQDDEALVGYNIVGEAGEKIKFFGKELKIAGRLSKTGMGFDGTVFVNMNTAKKLVQAGAAKGVQKAVDNSQVSVVMVKVKSGLDPIKVAGIISKNCSNRGIFAMASKSFVNDLADKLYLLAGFIRFSLVGLWVMALVILALSFTTMINERKRELSALRILGARRKQLVQIVLAEAWQLSFSGSLAGTLCGLLVTLISFPLLANRWAMPLPQPAWTTYLLFACFTLIVGMAVGPLASLPAAVKVSKRDAYTSMRETD